MCSANHDRRPPQRAEKGSPASSVANQLRAWLALSRPPFHTVGILPFVLGAVLAVRDTASFRWDICLWGVVGVVLVLLATYYAGEYWDQAEDTLSGREGPSRFAGGSQVVQRGLLPRRAPLWASLACLFLALAVGLVLQWGYRTGPWTLPLGLLGLLGGFFYSTRPLRWVRTGWGELWIAFCYGWLPIAVGYYLQTAVFAPLVHWLALPVGLTIFNVILLNEFPDYPADLATGKANLTVRLGRESAARLYGLASAASWGAVWLSLRHGVPSRFWWLGLPLLVLSLLVALAVLRGHWRERANLEKLCAANLGVNLGLTLSYILALVR
ncbi:MAG: prenyltransferase [Chloroflexi bacterium]|nr:prenyltransferase [Chloroflexota bacterium]